MKRKLTSLALAALMCMGISGITASATSSDNATSGEFVYEDNKPTSRITEYVGGGKWDHGTGFKVQNGSSIKTVYSNYYHKDKYHSSSCSVGSSTDPGKRTSPGYTSFTATEGPAAFQAKANWRHL